MKNKLSQMEEIMKNIIEDKIGVEEEMVDNEKIYQEIKKIQNNRETNGYIYISDTGISVEGTIPEVMCLFSNLVNNLKDNGIDKDLLEKAFKIGIVETKEKEEMLKDNIKKLIELMDNMED